MKMGEDGESVGGRGLQSVASVSGMQGPRIRVAGQHRDRRGREVRRVLTKRAIDSFATRRADRGRARARESGFLSRLFQRSVALGRRRGADPCPGAYAT